jgi:hypothetical protein
MQLWLQLWLSWAMASQNSILLQRWLHFVGSGAYLPTMCGYFRQGADNFVLRSIASWRIWAALFHVWYRYMYIVEGEMVIATFTVGLKMARIPSNNTIVNYSISTSFVFSYLVVFQKLPLLCLSSGNIFFRLFLITMLVALCQHFLLLIFYYYYWIIATVNSLLMHALIFSLVPSLSLFSLSWSTDYCSS